MENRDTDDAEPKAHSGEGRRTVSFQANPPDRSEAWHGPAWPIAPWFVSWSRLSLIQYPTLRTRIWVSGVSSTNAEAASMHTSCLARLCSAISHQIFTQDFLGGAVAKFLVCDTTVILDGHKIHRAHAAAHICGANQSLHLTVIGQRERFCQLQPACPCIL